MYKKQGGAMCHNNYRKCKCSGKNYKLLQKLSRKLKHDSVVIYGCGANGLRFFEYLQSLQVEPLYFIDRLAENTSFKVMNKRVKAPSSFVKDYANEKIIVSPDLHEEIYHYLLRSGIPVENIILPFFQFDGTIYLGKDLSEPSPDLVYSKVACDNPTVTVISVIYNTPEKLLRRSIESVLSQTDRNYEYLIVDNGSTDETGNIIKQYANLDKRINLIRIDNNILSWSNGTLISIFLNNIHGLYTCQCDSDDYLAPDYLEKAKQLLHQTSADILHVNMLRHSFEGFKYDSLYSGISGETVYDNKEFLKAYALGILYPNPFGYFCKAEVYRSFLEDVSKTPLHLQKQYYALDVSWTFDLLKKADKICHTDEVMYFYTLRAGSSSDDMSAIVKRLVEIYRNYKLMKSYSHEMGLSDSYANIFCYCALLWLSEILEKMITNKQCVNDMKFCVNPYEEEIILELKEDFHFKSLKTNPGLKLLYDIFLSTETEKIFTILERTEKNV